jgi:hypothetical protein
MASLAEAGEVPGALSRSLLVWIQGNQCLAGVLHVFEPVLGYDLSFQLDYRCKGMLEEGEVGNQLTWSSYHI